MTPVQDASRKLTLKFGPNGSVTAEIMLTLSVYGGGGGVVCRVIFMSTPSLVKLWLSWGFDNEKSGQDTRCFSSIQMTNVAWIHVTTTFVP